MQSAVLLFAACATVMFWSSASAIDIPALLKTLCAPTAQKNSDTVKMDADDFDPALGKAPRVAYVADCHATDADKHYVHFCNLKKPIDTPTLQLAFKDSDSTDVDVKVKNQKMTCTFTCAKRSAATLKPCIIKAASISNAQERFINSRT